MIFIKIALIIVITLIMLLDGFSQNNYQSLYSDKGELLYDSIYKIPEFDNLPSPSYKERGFHYMILTSISYPKEAINNGIGGIVVLQLKLEKKNDGRFYLSDINSISDSISIITEVIIRQVENVFLNTPFYSENYNQEDCKLLIPMEFKFIYSDKKNVTIVKNFFSEEKKCFMFTVELSPFNSH